MRSVVYIPAISTVSVSRREVSPSFAMYVPVKLSLSMLSVL